MVSIRRQSASRTLMPALAQRLGCVRSTKTSLTRTTSVHLNQAATSVFSFVRDFIEKGRPSGIIDTLGKHPACKSFDVQIFDGYHAIIVDQPTRNLVVKVRPLIMDVRVRSLQKLYGFPATMRTFLSSGNLTLCLAEFCLCLTVVAWIVNLRSIRKRGKRGQANIYADAFKRRGQVLRFTLNGKTREPSSGFALYGKRLNLALQRAMQFDFDLADFRQAQMRPLHGKAELRIGERIVSGAGTKARESGFVPAFHAGKEGFESLINTVQGVLQNLRIDIFKFFARRFDFRKLRALSGEVHRLAVDAPRIAAFLQRGVVEFRAVRKRAVKQSRLWLRRIDSVPKSQLRHASDSRHTALSPIAVRHPTPQNKSRSSSTASASETSNQKTLAANNETTRLLDSELIDECQTAGQLQRVGERGQALSLRQESRLRICRMFRARFVRGVRQSLLARRGGDISDTRQHATYLSTRHCCSIYSRLTSCVALYSDALLNPKALPPFGGVPYIPCLKAGALRHIW